ncbi:rabconnectin-3a, partial [Tremellales sp. Uapishka_1]
MSLQLRQAIPGRPNNGASPQLSTLSNGKGYIVYPSSSNVVVLDADLQLSDTLPFWNALPHRASSSSAAVEGVCCSSKEGLVVAWSDVHVVIWQKTHIWKVHSTVVASSSIKCLDLQSGTLVLGTQDGMELWRMEADLDVVVWDRLWDRKYPSPPRVHLHPTSSHVAWYSAGAKSVHIHTLNTKGRVVGIAQEIRAPREIEWIGWRAPKSVNDDAHLYTITTNSVLRVYSPVLDDPLWFQLLSSLDHQSFTRSLKPSSKGKEPESTNLLWGKMWVIDADALRIAVGSELDGQETIEPEARKIMASLATEECDVVCWVGGGRMVLRSILNLDRKPPTLLKSLPLASVPVPPAIPSWSPYARTLQTPSGLVVILPPYADRPISTCRLKFSALLAANPLGLASSLKDAPPLIQMTENIDHFVRTPNGRALLCIGEHGELAVYNKEQVGKNRSMQPLLGKGNWSVPHPPSKSAIFAKGRAIVFYTHLPGSEAVLTLQHLDPGDTAPTPPVTLPHFSLKPDEELAMLLAVSDIDDGFSGRGRRTQRALIMGVSSRGEAWVWRVSAHFMASESSIAEDTVPDVTLLSHYQLPVEGELQLVLPVDPMGWHTSVIDWEADAPAQDVVLTVSKDGYLEFWRPKLGLHLVGENGELKHADGCRGDGGEMWSRTGWVRTGKRDIVSARCSSRKKTVLVCEKDDGVHEMTIWDSNISEFSTGLELTLSFGKGEVIQDLDWTTTSDLQSVLAVGFAHKVVLVCEQRMSYVTKSPGWAPFLTIDLSRYTSVPINDSIWLAGGSLAVGAGNQIYLFSRFLARNTPVSSPSASVKSVTLDDSEPEDMFQLIAHQNGPLWDYHPIVLGQCLLWNKVDLVKDVLVALLGDLKRAEEGGKRKVDFSRLEPSRFWGSVAGKATTRKYDGLFESGSEDVSEEDGFTEARARDLIQRLDGPVRLPLSEAEKSALATLAQATLEIESQRRSLDLCGLRYLISLRLFVNYNRRSTSGTSTPRALSATESDRISFRNIVWASHSGSQEILLSATTDCCDHKKMVWTDAQRYGVFLWLKSTETIKSQLEVIARNRFMQDEERDPTSCSLIYFTLGKKKVVHGLWRQAPGHKEQQAMLKFLMNDFELPRWKTAAMKNAYALLAKQRFEYAAAFFMLAGSPKDALNVCLRQLGDFQLGIALARAIEGYSDVPGPLVRWILTDTVIPMAFQGGHRWLASWGLWELGRRDLAVRVLVSPMEDVLTAYQPVSPLNVGETENDDPSLLLLFQHLKSKSLQTAKGTNEIPSKVEFDFVLHNARVFFRMGQCSTGLTLEAILMPYGALTGCHSLALDLLRSWSFERPFFPRPTPQSPAYVRRPSFMLSATGRRESMVNDLTTDHGILAPDPKVERISEEKEKEEETKEAPKKVGNLMKELKQDVAQGAMEFDMGSFF